MAWTEVSKEHFQGAMDALNGVMGDVIAGLHFPMIEYHDELKCVVRDAGHDSRDPPPAGYGAYLIEGDLTVEQAISLSHLNEPGADGNMVFIVTGNVTCPRFVSEWACVVIIGGDLVVSELLFTDREDSTYNVLGDVSIWCFIGRDIPIVFEEGRTVQITYGLGYTTPRQRRNGVFEEADSIHPVNDEEASLKRMGFKDKKAITDFDMALYDEGIPSLR